MSWKQPIPTNINEDPNLGFLERAILREILCLCQNQPYLARFEHAGRWFTVKLLRGQCIFKVQKISKSLEINHKKIRRAIEIISEWYSPLESKAMPFGLIITVKNYDELTKMESLGESEGKVKGKYRESEGRPNKSDIDIEDNKDLKDTTTMSAGADAGGGKLKKEKKQKEINTEKPHRTLTDSRARKELEQFYLPVFNESTGSNIKSTGDLRDYWRFWRKDFSIREICSCIKFFYQLAWVTKLKKEHRGADLLLRKQDGKGQAVNRIQETMILKQAAKLAEEKKIKAPEVKQELQLTSEQRHREFIRAILSGVQTNNKMLIGLATRQGWNLEEIQKINIEKDLDKYLNLYKSKQEKDKKI